MSLFSLSVETGEMKSTLATLLVLGLLTIGTADKSAVCCGVEGCFCNGAPWRTADRQVPAPRCKVLEYTSVTVYSRSSMDGQSATMGATISLPNFNGKLPTTLLIAGFYTKPLEMYDLKDAILGAENANVIFIKWGDGNEKNLTYSQAVSDSRVVGARVSRLVRFLKESYSIDPKKLKCVGQGSGAHICGYSARPLMLGQITALDAPGPFFEDHCPEVRLNTNDTDLLIAIHTNGKSLRRHTGFGMIHPYGHVDFYVNGGEDQPGCTGRPKRPIVKKLSELHGDKLRHISEYEACPYSRAVEVYTDAVRNPDCTMWGHKRKTFWRREISVSKPLKRNRFKKCTLKTCSPLGPKTANFPGRKSFYLPTEGTSPFCWPEPETTSRMNKLLTKAKH